MYMHSLFEKSRANSLRIISYGARRWAWYLSTVQIEPGVSTGASFNVIPPSLTFSRISFEENSIPCSPGMESGEPTYTIIHWLSIHFRNSLVDWDLKHAAERKWVAEYTKYRTGRFCRNIVSTFTKRFNAKFFLRLLTRTVFVVTH